LRTIAFANQKGGVGKTTTTLNVGAALKERGEQVLILDFDPQGSLTLGLGHNPYDLKATIYDVLIGNNQIEDVILSTSTGASLIPANIDLSGAEVELLNEIGREHILRDALAPLQDRYKFLLIDCPPSLGLLTVNALTAADEVIIPVQTQYFSFRGMQLLFGTIEKIKQRSNPALQVLGVLPNIYDSRNRHNKEVLEELRSTYSPNGLLIDIVIPNRVALQDSPVGGQSILEFDGDSDVAKAFRSLAEVILHAR
jgi:chromosome partitioning protein